MAYDDNGLLDYVAKQTGARTDRQLAALLHTSPPVISKIRSGQLAVGAAMQLVMLEHLGLSLARLRRYVPSSLKRFREAA